MPQQYVDRATGRNACSNAAGAIKVCNEIGDARQRSFPKEIAMDLNSPALLRIIAASQPARTNVSNAVALPDQIASKIGRQAISSARRVIVPPSRCNQYLTRHFLKTLRCCYRWIEKQKFGQRY